VPRGAGSVAVLGRVETIAASQPIDEVFVALPLDTAQPLIRALVSLCEEQGITVRLVSNLVDLILARAQMQLGRCPDAIASYRRYAALVPTSADAHYWIATCAERLNGVDLALDEVSAALALDPQQPAIHRNLGMLLAQLGRYDEAIPHLRATLQMAPNEPAARETLEAIEATRR